MDAFLGTWTGSLESAENIDAFLEKTKIPPQFINAVKKRQYTTIASKQGDTYHVINKITSDPQSKEVVYEFQLGKEYEVTDHDGRKTKRVTTWENDKIQEIRTDDAGHQSFLTIEFLEGGHTATQTMTFDGVSTKLSLRKV
ncbi:fatty acid-binding protein, liver [Plakobranchus ocellatus]|uniref:Fatty acid-binding protein, liver n=1 Tax=Plakobranchus ocellatus TaxID=259542 RepID=A0AAV4DDT6_9GAST|nr:fatty acid-binding protein, liver [Plakobranchus ocellatus]